MKKLRGAIIGLGNIATRGHLPAYTDELVRSQMEIVAAMDVVEHNGEKLKEILPGAHFYSTMESLLRSEELDFVDICTPPHTHAEYIKACGAKGIHIVCEKPLAENFISVQDVIDVLKMYPVVFVPCHQYKYSPLWTTLHDYIHSGRLGKPILAQFNVYRMHADTGTAGWNPEWRTNKKLSGGGILVDTGAHYFYLVQHFFGMPDNLTAQLRTLKHREYGVEDTALVTLEYNGLLVQINLTWAASHRGNSVVLIGTEGSLTYDGSKLLYTNASGIEEIPMPDISDKKQYISWYASLFNDAASRILNRNASGDLLCEAENVMKMLEKCNESSSDHMRVGTK